MPVSTQGAALDRPFAFEIEYTDVDGKFGVVCVAGKDFRDAHTWQRALEREIHHAKQMRRDMVS